jgi:hypothetical protein
VIDLENAWVRFVPGPVDALAGVTLTGPTAGSSWLIGGVGFSVAG